MRSSVALLASLLLGLPLLPARDAGVQPDATLLPDPAPLRLKLLAEMDARIDAQAARAHLEARLLLDEVMPIAFFGVVADPAEGGMKISQIYPSTAAEASGVRVGDVILEFAGVKTDSKATLYRTIRCHAVGEKVAFQVRRGAETLTLFATPGKRAEEDEEDEEQFPDLSATAPVARGLPALLDFEKQSVGSVPPSIESVLSGHGEPARFVVAGGSEGLFLCNEQRDPTGLRFPIALVRDVDAADVVGRVRFRLCGGIIDRAAGIVLRYRNPTNYLVARVNSIEGDLRIFRVVNGMRRTLPGGVATVKIEDGVWHVLEFSADGAKIEAALDDSVRVSCLDTWFLRGGVGVWTKSDSETEFDDLSFTAPAR